MTEQVTVHEGEDNNLTTARGKPYLSLAKRQQLEEARNAKKRKAEEAFQRQEQMDEKLNRIEGVLQRIQQPPIPPVKTNRVQDDYSDEEEEVEYPAAMPKRRRLMNTHRREPRVEPIEPTGWSTWTKVGSLAGAILFNAVVAGVLSKLKPSNKVTNTEPVNTDSNIGYE